MEQGKRIQVAVGIVFEGGRLLIARRPDGVALAGYWEFPGGKLEPGETPEAAAMRELLEEIGVTVDPVRRLPVIIHAYPHGTVELTPVLCRLAGGSPRALGCVEFRWVLPAELPDYAFPPANAGLLAELMKMAGPFP